MHKLVTDLEQRGLVTLQAKPGHGRTLNAHLTDAGDNSSTTLTIAPPALEDRMVADLDKHQQRDLARPV